MDQILAGLVGGEHLQSWWGFVYCRLLVQVLMDCVLLGGVVLAHTSLCPNLSVIFNKTPFSNKPNVQTLQYDSRNSHKITFSFLLLCRQIPADISARHGDRRNHSY
jgi:hypothetical protein